MKSLGYLSAFLGGAIAGAALGILMAPEKGEDTRVKITDAVEDFLKKHNIKLSRKEVVDLVDDIEDATGAPDYGRRLGNHILFPSHHRRLVRVVCLRLLARGLYRNGMEFRPRYRHPSAVFLSGRPFP